MDASEPPDSPPPRRIADETASQRNLGAVARIVPDEPGLCIAYWRRISWNPPLAAFEGGRMLNRLRFEAIQAQLCLRGQHDHLAREVARDLGRLARTFQDQVESRDEVEAEIIEKNDELIKFTYNYLSHECLCALGDELDNPYYNEEFVPEYPDYDGKRRELIASVLGPAFGAIAPVRNALWRLMGDRDRSLLTLGERIDQVIRHPHIENFLYEEIVSNAQISRPPGSRQAEANRSGPRREVYRFVAREAGEIPPMAGWADGVEQLMIELGLESILPPAILEWHLAGGAALVTLTVRLASSVKDALTDRRTSSPGSGVLEVPMVGDGTQGKQPKSQHGTVPSSIFDETSVLAGSNIGPGIGGWGQAGAAAPAPTGRHLGLIIDENRHQIRREGWEGVVDLRKRPLAWNLFK